MESDDDKLFFPQSTKKPKKQQVRSTNLQGPPPIPEENLTLGQITQLPAEKRISILQSILGEYDNVNRRLDFSQITSPDDSRNRFKDFRRETLIEVNKRKHDRTIAEKRRVINEELSASKKFFNEVKELREEEKKNEEEKKPEEILTQISIPQSEPIIEQSFVMPQYPTFLDKPKKPEREFRETERQRHLDELKERKRKLKLANIRQEMFQKEISQALDTFKENIEKAAEEKERRDKVLKNIEKTREDRLVESFLYEQNVLMNPEETAELLKSHTFKNTIVYKRWANKHDDKITKQLDGMKLIFISNAHERDRYDEIVETRDANQTPQETWDFWFRKYKEYYETDARPINPDSEFHDYPLACMVVPLLVRESFLVNRNFLLVYETKLSNNLNLSTIGQHTKALEDLTIKKSNAVKTLSNREEEIKKIDLLVQKLNEHKPYNFELIILEKTQRKRILINDAETVQVEITNLDRDIRREMTIIQANANQGHLTMFQRLIEARRLIERIDKSYISSMMLVREIASKNFMQWVSLWAPQLFDDLDDLNVREESNFFSDPNTKFNAQTNFPGNRLLINLSTKLKEINSIPEIMKHTLRLDNKYKELMMYYYFMYKPGYDFITAESLAPYMGRWFNTIGISWQRIWKVLLLNMNTAEVQKYAPIGTMDLMQIDIYAECIHTADLSYYFQDFLQDFLDQINKLNLEKPKIPKQVLDFLDSLLEFGRDFKELLVDRNDLGNLKFIEIMKQKKTLMYWVNENGSTLDVEIRNKHLFGEIISKPSKQNPDAELTSFNQARECALSVIRQYQPNQIVKIRMTIAFHREAFATKRYVVETDPYDPSKMTYKEKEFFNESMFNLTVAIENPNLLEKILGSNQKTASIEFNDAIMKEIQRCFKKNMNKYGDDDESYFDFLNKLYATKIKFNLQFATGHFLDKSPTIAGSNELSYEIHDARKSSSFADKWVPYMSRCRIICLYETMVFQIRNWPKLNTEFRKLKIKEYRDIVWKEFLKEPLHLQHAVIAGDLFLTRDIVKELYNYDMNIFFYERGYQDNAKIDGAIDWTIVCKEGHAYLVQTNSPNSIELFMRADTAFKRDIFENIHDVYVLKNQAPRKISPNCTIKHWALDLETIYKSGYDETGKLQEKTITYHGTMIGINHDEKKTAWGLNCEDEIVSWIADLANEDRAFSKSNEKDGEFTLHYIWSFNGHGYDYQLLIAKIVRLLDGMCNIRGTPTALKSVKIGSVVLMDYYKIYSSGTLDAQYKNTVTKTIELMKAKNDGQHPYPGEIDGYLVKGDVPHDLINEENFNEYREVIEKYCENDCKMTKELVLLHLKFCEEAKVSFEAESGAALSLSGIRPHILQPIYGCKEIQYGQVKSAYYGGITRMPGARFAEEMKKDLQNQDTVIIEESIENPVLDDEELIMLKEAEKEIREQSNRKKKYNKKLSDNFEVMTVNEIGDFMQEYWDQLTNEEFLLIMTSLIKKGLTWEEAFCDRKGRPYEIEEMECERFKEIQRNDWEEFINDFNKERSFAFQIDHNDPIYRVNDFQIIEEKEEFISNEDDDHLETYAEVKKKFPWYNPCIVKNGAIYDANSLYPSVWADAEEDMPVMLESTNYSYSLKYDRRNGDRAKYLQLIEKGSLYFVKSFKWKKNGFYYPFFPLRLDGKPLQYPYEFNGSETPPAQEEKILGFSGEGRFMCGEEILLALQYDCLVSIEIEGKITTKKRPYLRGFVLKFYNFRLEAKRGGMSAKEKAIKVILNSGYGKTAQQLYSRCIFTSYHGMIYITAVYEGTDYIKSITPIGPDKDCYLIEFDDRQYSTQIGSLITIGCFTTARARVRIMDFVLRATKGGTVPSVVYMDTDSAVFYVDHVDWEAIKPLLDDEKLGMFKCEHMNSEFHIIGPKCYYYICPKPCNKDCKGGVTLKCKGVPKNRLTLELMQQIEKDGFVVFENLETWKKLFGDVKHVPLTKIIKDPRYPNIDEKIAEHLKEHPKKGPLPPTQPQPSTQPQTHPQSLSIIEEEEDAMEETGENIIWSEISMTK